MKHTILVVDDERDNTEALERLFRRKYQVLKALSGPDALKILASHPNIPLIISDQRMPDMTGVQFLEKSIKTHPNTMRILLTGFTDIESVIEAINSGQVYRYLTKPWDPIDLKATVDRAIERFELSQEIIRQNKELSVLDKAKDQFMILINHELKTPLTSILSFLSLLKESGLNDEQEMYTNRIETGAFRLQKLINQSLRLIQAEAGKIEIKAQKTSLKNLKAQVTDSKFIQDISDKKQNFEILLNEENEAIFDLEIIGSCLLELLQNAHRFSPEGASLQLKSKDQGDQIRICLTNTQVSMDQDIIDKVLKPFSLNEDIMNHSKGLGLGLTLTNALLKTHKTELNIKSEDHCVSVCFSLQKIEG